MIGIIVLVAIAFGIIAGLWIKANKKSQSVKPVNGGGLPNNEDKKEQQTT